MAIFTSKYTGPEIESLLDKVNNNNIITVDNRLSSTSINPVQNKVVEAALGDKQDKLESGYNIKTINGKSILGYGNIEIQGGTGGGEGITESEVNDIIEDKLSTKNYATKAEVNEGLRKKQDAISDLATIRSGAAKGATSVQSDDLALVATSGSYDDLKNKPITVFEKGDADNSAVLKGGNNKAINANEVALGKYNESNSDTYFSIGIGTSDSDRKNAVEVNQNGGVYIIGIGGFIGANSDSSKSVQEVINELVNKLNEITIND